MEEKTKKLIWVLIFVILALGSWIAYEQIKGYGLRKYTFGLQDGQLVLAADQLGRQQVTFFNGTSIKTIAIRDLCSNLNSGGLI